MYVNEYPGAVKSNYKIIYELHKPLHEDSFDQALHYILKIFKTTYLNNINIVWMIFSTLLKDELCILHQSI